jgi:hypothetical protein
MAEDRWAEFDRLVNMTARALEAWLDTDESKAAGWKGADGKGNGESVGHASGRRIVRILQAGKPARSEEDSAHAAKVVGYIKRHLAQRPDGDVTDTRWRHSLMNWGHDPEKE